MLIPFDIWQDPRWHTTGGRCLWTRLFQEIRRDSLGNPSAAGCCRLEQCSDCWLMMIVFFFLNSDSGLYYIYILYYLYYIYIIYYTNIYYVLLYYIYCPIYWGCSSTGNPGFSQLSGYCGSSDKYAMGDSVNCTSCQKQARGCVLWDPPH